MSVTPEFPANEFVTLSAITKAKISMKSAANLLQNEAYSSTAPELFPAFVCTAD